MPSDSQVLVEIRRCTDVDSDVCKCRCRMSTGFPANVDRKVENISIYHGKKAQKNQNHMLKKCRIIYTYTHTHTHNKAHFSSFFTRNTPCRFLLGKQKQAPIHFATDRFTFEKFPPPPPLLHPRTSVVTAMSRFYVYLIESVH